MGKVRQSREERLQKKRIAERKRKARLKNNPEEHEKLKEEDRNRYHKKKAEKKILSIPQLPSQKRKIVRERNRINSMRYRERKKNTARITDNEELIDIVNDNIDTVVQDPLAETSTSIQIQLRSSSSKSKLSIDNPKNTSNHVSRSLQRVGVTRRQTERTNSSLNLSDLSIIKKSTQSDLLHDEISVNDSPQQTLVSSSPKLTTLSAIKVNTTPVTRSSRLGDRMSRRLFRHSSHSSSSVCLSPSSEKSVTSISTTKSKIQISEKSQGMAHVRKFKYKMGKEMNILHKRIAELTQLNEKYRKQMFRLKKYININTSSKSGTDSDTSCNIAERKKKIPINNLKNSINKKQLEEDIHNFYIDDDNSRMCPGKKEYITRGKVRKQKRYLSESILNLHKKFKKMHPNYIVSYSHFWKLKPFWVVIPNMRIRDTCMCVKHDNMQLIISSLKRNNIITENSSRDVLNSMCCNAMDPKCLNRDCGVCINRQLHYHEFNNGNEISYWSWKALKKPYVKNGQTKFATQTSKVKNCAAPKDIINELEKMLPLFLKHCAIIVSQSAHMKKIKHHLRANETVVHCDFSENYGLKYSNEIQAIHFGGSRQQITLHTVVIYYFANGNLQTQALCTMSSCLRHDAISIWEHLMPVLRFIEDNCSEVDTIHFLSDSPSGQYRNCKMFYVISKLHWHFPSLRLVTWNYSESGHGKGAPDGVGGVLKRTADQIVARGRDIADLETLFSVLKSNVPGVICEVIDESGIQQKDMLVPTLRSFKGTMRVHQAVWDANDKYTVALRSVSCTSGECAATSIRCYHGKHVGFFCIDPPPPDLEPILMQPTITLNDPPVCKEISLPAENKINKGQSNVSDNLVLDSDDSFWVKMPTDEMIITPSTSAMNKKSFLDIWDSDDENIF